MDSLAGPKCGSCSAPLSAEWNVCRRCGMVQRQPSAAAEERELLHEWNMVASWAVGARGPDADLQAVVRNGLLPNDPELLVEEAERCLRYLREGQSQFQRRLEALLTRADLLALKEPVLARRAEVLRKAAQELAARDRRETWGCLGGMLAGVGLIAGLIALGISRCG